MTQKDIPVNIEETSLGASSGVHYTFGESGFVDSNGNETKDLTPLKNMKFINTGATLIRVTINGRKGYEVLPAGTIGGVEDDEITSLYVHNTSTTNAGAYSIVLDSKDTMLSLLKRLLQ